MGETITRAGDGMVGPPVLPGTLLSLPAGQTPDHMWYAAPSRDTSMRHIFAKTTIPVHYYSLRFLPDYYGLPALGGQGQSRAQIGPDIDSQCS